MKNTIKILALFAAAVFLFSCQQSNNGSPGASAELNTELDSVCYALGLDIGKNIKTQGFEEINSAAIAEGFEDAFKDVDPKITQEQAQNMIRTYIGKVREIKHEKNLADAEKFLEENKTKEGVETLPSGLQYKVLEEGSGPSPAAEDKVRVHYKGTLTNGTVFESSYESGQPAEFRVNGVIKGWTEALTMMKVGGKWKLFIPPGLAYGKNPRPGGMIEPNMALVFEIELLEIVDDKK